MSVINHKKETVKCSKCGKEFILETKVYAQKIEARDTLTYNCPYCNNEHSVVSSGNWEIEGVRKID